MADLSRIQLNKQGNAGQVKPKSGSTTKAADKKPVTVNFSSTKGSTFSAPLKNSTLTSSLETTGSSSKDVAVFAEDTKAGAGAKTDDYARRNTIKAKYGNMEADLQSALKGGGVTAGISDRFYAGQNTASATNLSEAQSYIGQATSYKREADQCMANGDYDGAIAAYKKAENSLKQAQRQLAGKTDKDSTALQQQTSILRSQYAASREKLQERKQMRAISSGTGTVCSGNCSSGSSFSLSDLNGLLGSVNSLAKTLSGGSAGSGSGVGSGSGFKLGSSSSSKTTPSGSFFGGLKAALTGSSNTLKVDSKYANLAGVKAARTDFDKAAGEQAVARKTEATKKQEIKALEIEKKTVEKQLEAELDKLNDSDTTKTKVADLTKAQGELAEMQQNNAKYQAQVDANQKVSNEFSEKITGVNTKIETASADVASKEAAYNGITIPKPQKDEDGNVTNQAEIDALKLKKEKAKEDWEKAKAKLAELLKQRETYTKGKADADAKVKAAQDSMTREKCTATDIQAKKAEVEKLQKEITEARGKDDPIVKLTQKLSEIDAKILKATQEKEAATALIDASEIRKDAAQENADIAVEAAEDPADFVEDNEKSIDAQMGVWKQQDAFRKTIDPIGSFQVRTDYSASEYLRKNYGLPNIIQGAQYGQYTAAQIAESKNELVRLGIIKPESLRKN